MLDITFFQVPLNIFPVVTKEFTISIFEIELEVF